jgi:hypothetical protein
MTFELGVYSFGNTLRTADGGHDTTAQALRNVLEAVHIADEVGLDFFGFGEHHTQSMPVSSPTALVNAADIAVAVHGFVAENDREAKRTYLEHELRMFHTGSAEIGRPMRPLARRPSPSSHERLDQFPTMPYHPAPFVTALRAGLPGTIAVAVP